MYISLEDLGIDPSAAGLVEPVDEIGETVAQADVVFEVGPEDLAWKRKVFEYFEQIQLMAPAHAMLASNATEIPITQIMEG